VVNRHVVNAARRPRLRPLPSVARGLLRALVVAGCGAGLAAQPKPGLLATDLANFTYDLGDDASVEGGKVPLKGGNWKDTGDGGSVFVLDSHHALGDLDADGIGDGAAILVERSSGSGTFYYLFALLSRGGAAVQAGPPEWLGDRSVIERVAIDRKGIIAVRFVTHKDNDPLCCPTMRIEDRYRIVDGVLKGITK
jgi:hypothetical protein